MIKAKNNLFIKSSLLIITAIVIAVSSFMVLFKSKSNTVVNAESVNVDGTEIVYDFSTQLLLYVQPIISGGNNWTETSIKLDIFHLTSTYFDYRAWTKTNIIPGSEHIDFSTYDDYVQFNVVLNSSGDYIYRAYYLVNTGFSGNVVRYEYHASPVPALENTQGNRYQQIKFFDENNNIFGLYFQYHNPWSTFATLVSKKLYYTTSLSDGNYYDIGFSDGYNNGVNYGTDVGYETGYSVGNSIGYSDGYNDGVASATNYSFLGLIGAVIDAPLKAFYGLFNFEILGTNIAGFITAILTLAIVIYVIRFALGKGGGE